MGNYELQRLIRNIEDASREAIDALNEMANEIESLGKENQSLQEEIDEHECK